MLKGFFVDVTEFIANNDNYFLTIEKDVHILGRLNRVVTDQISGRMWMVNLRNGKLPVDIIIDLGEWNKRKDIFPALIDCLNHKHGFDKDSTLQCKDCIVKYVMSK